MSFATIPSKATLKPQPFKAQVSDQELADFKQLLRLSRLGPKTYENQVANVKNLRGWGITHQWLQTAKKHWESSYDWRRTEARINSYPNFTVPIADDAGFTYNIHFIGLFSAKPDAIPITLLHGWPGSFLEFLGTLDLLRSKYTPDTLPYHIIVPSLPGYGYSSAPSLDKDTQNQDAAHIIDKLMHGLGFGDGYIAQGGDIGSFIARILGATSPACKAVHLNMCTAKPGPTDGLHVAEQQGLQRAGDFGQLGYAYAKEHGTRPATIGLVLSSSPLALLAWIGEKFQQWSDESPPLDTILDFVTLYWFNSSFPTSIYSYRQTHGPAPTSFHPDPEFYIDKPLGYSGFPHEIVPMPQAWIATTGNLVWFRAHDAGGHFAALERPSVFLQDVEDFVAEAWARAKGSKI